MNGARLLCVLALLFVGFAHKVPMVDGASAQSVELSQYVFPDGTPHVLCLPGEAGDDGHEHPDFGSGCEACRLSASILVPVAGDAAAWLVRLPVGRLAPMRAEPLGRSFLLPNAAPRGPPPALIAGIAVAPGSGHLSLRRTTSA